MLHNELMPLQERVLDRLADALFEAHDILCILDDDEAKSLQWIAPDVRSIYRSVDLLMKRLAD
jgi:hypothetical protein